MSTALEIALMLVGFFALGWAILNSRASIAARLIAIVLGIAAPVAAHVFLTSSAAGQRMPSQDGLLQGGAIGQLAGPIVERRGLPSIDIDLRIDAHLHSSSASRFTAGAAGSFFLSQWAERPARYGDPSRFETMPSQPSAQACL